MGASAIWGFETRKSQRLSSAGALLLIANSGGDGRQDRFAAVSCNGRRLHQMHPAPFIAGVFPTHFSFFCSFPSNGPAFLFPRLELRQSWRGSQELQGRAGVYPTNAEFVRFSGGRKLLRTILARLQQGEFRFSREESLEDIPRM